MSRPTVFTKDTLQKLEHAFALGCTDEEACIFADIAPSSLYHHQIQNREFLERKLLLRKRPVLEARMCLMEGVRKDPGLALKFLDRKARSEFVLGIEADADPADMNYKLTLMQEYKRIFDRISAMGSGDRIRSLFDSEEQRQDDGET